MNTLTQTWLDLPVSDLMTVAAVRLPEDMPLGDAVRLIVNNQISGRRLWTQTVDAWVCFQPRIFSERRTYDLILRGHYPKS